MCGSTPVRYATSWQLHRTARRLESVSRISGQARKQVVAPFGSRNFTGVGSSCEEKWTSSRGAHWISLRSVSCNRDPSRRCAAAPDGAGVDAVSVSFVLRVGRSHEASHSCLHHFERLFWRNRPRKDRRRGKGWHQGEDPRQTEDSRQGEDPGAVSPVALAGRDVLAPSSLQVLRRSRFRQTWLGVASRHLVPTPWNFLLHVSSNCLPDRRVSPRCDS